MFKNGKQAFQNQRQHKSFFSAKKSTPAVNISDERRSIKMHALKLFLTLFKHFSENYDF
jgi:hypothetical protein